MTKPVDILRHFSKLTCLATLLLIFVGGLVTSTGSGLSVPDWPLSYGMLFPPMVGGVFYEHGHRMAATLVGFLTLCLTVLIWKLESRRWLKNLGIAALCAVIVQGILGGITVKFFLPLPVSVSHGVLAQSFFIMTVVIAYAFSAERAQRTTTDENVRPVFLRLCLLLIISAMIQLVFGAIMRHMQAGLAVPDFPTMAGEWWPRIDPATTERINSWRFEQNLDPVNSTQIFFHLLHRFGALFLLGIMACVNWVGLRDHTLAKDVRKSIIALDTIFLVQIILGILTVLSMRQYHVASLHVMVGALFLGWAVLLFLRSAPITLKSFKNAVFR